MVMYTDGIVGGNVLASSNRRKGVVWYISFLEFGRAIYSEAAWIPIAFARIVTCCYIHPACDDHRHHGGKLCLLHAVTTA